jgi:WD40 repeat protein
MVILQSDHSVIVFLGIYDSTTLNLKNSLIGHTDTVNKIIQLENDDICSCSFDKTIKCWDWNTKKLKLNLIGHNWEVTSIVLLHSGYLASSELGLPNNHIFFSYYHI